MQRWMLSAEDHAEALLVLLRHDRLLLVPAFTITRAILECVLNTCWVLDVSKRPEIRIARAATMQLALLNDSIKTLERFDDQAELEEKRQTRRDLVRLLVRDGLGVDFVEDKKGQSTEAVARVHFKGVSVSVNQNMTTLTETYLADSRWVYALLSGAAHGRPWLLTGLGDDANDAIRAVALLNLTISEAYTKALTSYFDVDAQRYVRKRRTRTQAILLDRNQQ